MRLYRLDEVEAAELRPNIRRALRFPPPPPQGRLSEAALRGVQAGWQEYVDALVPSVQIIPLDELRSASIASYLAWAEGRVMYPRNVSDENTVLGLMFGYVRRELVDWEAIAAALPAPLVPSDVKYICSDRIKAAIIEAYPSLAFPSR